MRRAAQLVAAAAAVFYLGIGVWAFAAPASFFAHIAAFPPYNEHFLHDIGAFTIGLGAAAVAGLLVSDGLTAVLGGIAVGSVLHEIAHVMDRALGGKPSDPWLLGLLALVVTAGAIAAARSIGPRLRRP
jgi:hypothetical protein